MPISDFRENDPPAAGLLSDSDLLSRVETAAAHRRYSEKTLEAYRRTWIRFFALAAATGLEPVRLRPEEARELYKELGGGRSPSHHLQARAALRFIYQVLDLPNPFEKVLAPKFDIAKIEIKYLTASQVGLVLGTLKKDEGYFGQMTYTLAAALYLTAARYNEWASLERDRLLTGENGMVVRLRTKGTKFSDLRLPDKFVSTLRHWLTFSESMRGVRLLNGCVEFAGSQFVFPGRDGKPFTNEAFNTRLKAACKEAGVPIITAHGLRHAAATALLNERRLNLKEVQEMLGHKNISTTTRYTHVDQTRLAGLSQDLESLLP